MPSRHLNAVHLTSRAVRQLPRISLGQRRAICNRCDAVTLGDERGASAQVSGRRLDSFSEKSGGAPRWMVGSVVLRGQSPLL